MIMNKSSKTMEKIGIRCGMRYYETSTGCIELEKEDSIALPFLHAVSMCEVMEVNMRDGLPDEDRFTDAEVEMHSEDKAFMEEYEKFEERRSKVGCSAVKEVGGVTVTLTTRGYKFE